MASLSTQFDAAATQTFILHSRVVVLNRIFDIHSFDRKNIKKVIKIFFG